MAARKTSKKTKTASPKPSGRAKAPRRRRQRSWTGLPVLDQHQRDLIGLGLIAVAAFLAFVLYGGGAGGEVGQAGADGLRLLVGSAAYLAPPTVLAIAVIVLMRDSVASIRPWRTGIACLLAGIVLGLSAGSLGLGPGAHAHAPLLDADYVSARGGVVGELAFYATSTLFSNFGSHLLFLFLVLAGGLLLTGASVASLVGSAADQVTTTGQRVRRSTEDLTQALQRRGESATTSAPAPVAPSVDAGPPEPPGAEPVVHATHVEAPALDGARHFPDLYDEADADEHEAWAEADGAEDGGGIEDEPGVLADPPVDAVPSESAEDDGSTAAEAPEQQTLTPLGNSRASAGVTEADDHDYKLPKGTFLKHSTSKQKLGGAADEKIGQQLVEALGHFGVEAKVVGSVSGPHVTRYELRLAPGIKMSKVAGMRDDLAYALAADDVRILAPIPGKRAVGVEVPNRNRVMVHLGDVAQEPPDGWSPLTCWLGKDIDGRAIGIDLASQPHVLVAGTTGSGKSGCVNAILSSILMRATPNEVRMVLVDPKQVELNLYEHVPHLLTPVVTSPRLAANVLQNLIREMEQRYTLMSAMRTRKLEELNRMRVRNGERPLPYVLCVIDELADLMMIAPGEVEDAIIRLAQKSRAVGIHLLLATQRPSVDIITGMIKTNVPARIAFAVSSQTDSRVILDQNGAESLLGKGDMLFRPGSGTKLSRIQGAFVGEEEIEKITGFWRKQGEPELHEELLEAVEEEDEGPGEGELDPDADDLLAEAIRTVVQMDTASTSMLQRRLRVGYTRAGRLVDMLERRGVISGYEGSKARKVLITEADLPRVLDALEGSAVAAGSEAGES